MELHNDFEVAAPVDAVWAYVLDVEKIAPCMPGAELTEVVDDKNWKGKVTVKVGPVSMSFLGTVTMQERDDAAHRVVLKADGRDSRGKGAANALVTALMEPAGDGTKVSIDTDTDDHGRRRPVRPRRHDPGHLRPPDQGVRHLPPVEHPCCRRDGGARGEQPRRAPSGAAAAAPAAPQPVTHAARPVGGVRLALWAMWRSIVRFFSRIFGGKEGSADG